MKINIWVIVLLFFTIKGYAQKKTTKADFFREEGKKFYSEHKYNEAITSFSKAIQKSPSNRSLYFDRANSYYNSGQYNFALTDCDKTIRLSKSCDSVCINAHTLKGNSYSILNLPDSAKIHFNHVLKERPKDLYNLSSMGEFYANFNHYDSSMYFFSKMREIDSNSIGPIVNMVFYSNELGHYKEAIDIGEKYAYKFQDSIWMAVNLNNIAYSKLMLSEDEEGILLINKSMSLFPGNSFAYKNRALYYIKKNDLVNACSDLNVAKELGGYFITKDLIEKYCKD